MDYTRILHLQSKGEQMIKIKQKHNISACFSVFQNVIKYALLKSITITKQ